MKTKILQEKLCQALVQVEKIAGKDATLPALNNILLKAEKNFLSTIATNLETGVSWKLLSKTEEEGSVAIPAQTFSGLVGSFPGGSINIENRGTLITVTGERRKSNLKGLAAEEFPVLPVNTEGEHLAVGADSFCQALSQVANFAGASSVKPEITGVYVVFDRGEIKIVATDSFRLGEKTIPAPKQQGLSGRRAVILPLRAVREIVSIFGNLQKNISIFFTNNQVTVESADAGDADQPQIQFVSRLIEGEFPDYQAIIPRSCAANIVFSKKELLTHLKSAGLFAGRGSEVSVKIKTKDSLVVISSQSADLGEYESEMKLESASGEDVLITFNCRFLSEGLNAIKNDKCVFEFSNDAGPGVLKPAGDPGFIYILMPIKKI